jgi:lysozyme
LAWSGHGTPAANKDDSGSLVLSNAKDEHDRGNSFPLKGLEEYVTSLADRCHNLVAFINTCHAGGFFTRDVRSGGNDFTPGPKGAHAVTASGPEGETYEERHLPGSYFFNALIAGVESGNADRPYSGTFNRYKGREIYLGGGIVRFGALMAYLNTALSPGLHLDLPQDLPAPMSGSILTNAQSRGAFFFLAPPQGDLAAAAKSLGVAPPPGGYRATGSGLVGVPGYAVFNAPSTYKIRGIRVNTSLKEADWTTIGTTPIRFAYIRASTGIKKEESFDHNWVLAGNLHLSRGAYHVYDPRESVEAQLSRIKESVPYDEKALPFCVFVPTYQAEQAAQVVEQMHQLKTECSKLFHKPVIIHGSAQFFADAEERGGSDDASNWLAYPRPVPTVGKETRPANDGKEPGRGNEPNAPARPAVVDNYSARDPWTIWEFSGPTRIPGTDASALNEAFFGTDDEFSRFSRGEPAVATKAISEPVRSEPRR